MIDVFMLYAFSSTVVHAQDLTDANARPVEHYAEELFYLRGTPIHYEEPAHLCASELADYAVRGASGTGPVAVPAKKITRQDAGPVSLSDSTLTQSLAPWAMSQPDPVWGPAPVELAYTDDGGSASDEVDRLLEAWNALPRASKFAKIERGGEIYIFPERGPDPSCTGQRVSRLMGTTVRLGGGSGDWRKAVHDVGQQVAARHGVKVAVDLSGAGMAKVDLPETEMPADAALRSVFSQLPGTWSWHIRNEAATPELFVFHLHQKVPEE